MYYSLDDCVKTLQKLDEVLSSLDENPEISEELPDLHLALSEYHLEDDEIITSFQNHLKNLEIR